MAYQVGYWTELGSMSFDESEMTTTFQAMPYGHYEHPIYGEIDFTPEKVDDIVRNFNSKVRGTDLDIDYDHKAKTGEAAGWVKAAEKRSDGLYLTVQWTKSAWQKIKERAYRYFSPEFADEWKHPKTGLVHKNVLFGGGITNRPFLKDILPLNMSELFAEQEEGTGMDPKKLRKLLGLPEDATDEQVETALQGRNSGGEGGASGDGNTDTGKDNGAQGNEGGEGSQTQPVAASEGLPPEVISLAESNPAVKALTELVSGLQQTVAQQSSALHLAEVNSKVIRLAEPTGNRQLPPAATQKLQEALLAPSVASIESFVETLNKAGYVELGETGVAGHGGEGDGSDAVKKFNDAVTKEIEQTKASYADAVNSVSSKDPQLFAEYRAASYAFREQ